MVHWCLDGGGDGKCLNKSLKKKKCYHSWRQTKANRTLRKSLQVRFGKLQLSRFASFSGSAWNLPFYLVKVVVMCLFLWKILNGNAARKADGLKHLSLRRLRWSATSQNRIKPCLPAEIGRPYTENKGQSACCSDILPFAGLEEAVGAL